MTIKCSVIIVNWNTKDLLAKALKSIPFELEDIDIELIVVDNNSTDGSLSMLESEFPRVKVVTNPENIGFASANNMGMQLAEGDYFLLLNSDAYLTADALQNMLNLAKEQGRAGVIGGKLLNPDGTFQASHARFPSLGQEVLMLSGLGRLLHGKAYPSFSPSWKDQPVRADYVVGACLLIRRDAYWEVGGFDEDYFMYAEEVDLCYRMRMKGWEVWYQPHAEIFHIGGASSSSMPEKREIDLYRSRVIFFQRHYGHQSAQKLASLILLFTRTKHFFHGIARKLTHGRYGRSLPRIEILAHELKKSL